MVRFGLNGERPHAGFCRKIIQTGPEINNMCTYFLHAFVGATISSSDIIIIASIKRKCVQFKFFADYIQIKKKF